jgi:putative ABC transport system substrate-binding protein
MTMNKRIGLTTDLRQESAGLPNRVNHADRRRFLLATGTLLAAPLAGAQPSRDRTARIGILVGGSFAQRGHLDLALLEGLRDQGYVEGKNLVIERRYADGRTERTPELARELAKMKLDAVVTTCTPTTRAARQASPSTPIVMAAVADPVGQRLIASLARPGANITGLSSQAEDILPKMMELFSSVLPTPATVAVFTQGKSDVHPRMWQRLGPMAQTLNLQLVKIEVANAADLPSAFDRALQKKANALLVLPDEPLFLTRRAAIVELAAKHRLPAFYGAREFVDDGGLMSYGESLRAAYRKAATYVRSLSRGAHPADLPVEQPTKFEMVINLRTALALGLTIPQSMLVRADEVIQ